jgi:hypothetical protein
MIGFVRSLFAIGLSLAENAPAFALLKLKSQFEPLGGSYQKLTVKKEKPSR